MTSFQNLLFATVNGAKNDEDVYNGLKKQLGIPLSIIKNARVSFKLTNYSGNRPFIIDIERLKSMTGANNIILERIEYS
jgi:hypothetical protein